MTKDEAIELLFSGESVTLRYSDWTDFSKVPRFESGSITVTQENGVQVYVDAEESVWMKRMTREAATVIVECVQTHDRYSTDANVALFPLGDTRFRDVGAVFGQLVDKFRYVSSDFSHSTWGKKLGLPAPHGANCVAFIRGVGDDFTTDTLLRMVDSTAQGVSRFDTHRIASLRMAAKLVGAAWEKTALEWFDRVSIPCHSCGGAIHTDEGECFFCYQSGARYSMRDGRVWPWIASPDDKVLSLVERIEMLELTQ